MTTKTAIFVDVQNIYYTTRDSFGRQFNYRKFWKMLESNHNIAYATAYAIEKNDNSQRKFQDALRHIGFTVKLKPYIQRVDGSAKGDWDVGITIDIMEQAASVDKIILLSGDGDFDLLLEKVSEKYNVITQVYGVPKLTAKSLIDAANEFNPITAEILL